MIPSPMTSYGFGRELGVILGLTACLGPPGGLEGPLSGLAGQSRVVLIDFREALWDLAGGPEGPSGGLDLLGGLEGSLWWS